MVPGVRVDLDQRSNEREPAHARRTNVGEYAFINVDPATYTVKVAMQGFKTVENKGVRIGTQQFVTLDFALEVGNLTEAITVEGQGSPLETSNASVGSTLDSATLQTLPTAGRNPFFLATITPGVTHTGDPQFIRQQDQTNSSLLSLGGGPRRGNNYTLDGVAIVDLRNRATIIPSIEAVEEVKVQVSTYDAEMGRTGGGVFNMTGKSGAQRLARQPARADPAERGAGPVVLRPEGLRRRPRPARSPTRTSTSTGAPWAARSSKDKTFFWASVEGYKTNTIDDAVVRAPSARELGGDFSQSGVTVYDPAHHPAGSRTTPASSSATRSRATSSPPTASAPWRAASRRTGRSRRTVQRPAGGQVDHRHVQARPAAGATSVRTSAMYAYYDSTEPQAALLRRRTIGENPADPGDGALFRTVHALAVNNTITPNPTTVAHVRLGYTTFADDCVPVEFDPGTLGFSPSFVSQIPQQKFPYIAIGGYGTDYNGVHVRRPRPHQDTDYYSWDANASMSKLWGRHTVKFGGSYRKIGMKNVHSGQTGGEFYFDGQFTSANPLSAEQQRPACAGRVPARLPVGAASSRWRRPNDFFINYYAGYVQDDFRINPNLTVNLGLRYEFEQGLQEKNNAFTVGFDRDRAWPVQVAGPHPAGAGSCTPAWTAIPPTRATPARRSSRRARASPGRPTPRRWCAAATASSGRPTSTRSPARPAWAPAGFTADHRLRGQHGRRPHALRRPARIVEPVPERHPAADGQRQRHPDRRRRARWSSWTSSASPPTSTSTRWTCSASWAGDVVAGIGYIGSAHRADRGGRQRFQHREHQPARPALPVAWARPCWTRCPNPFFGDPRFGAFAASATIARGQLLRPYPQFGDLLAHQVSEGKARYHSLDLRLERRIPNGWGGRINYTWSSNKNNIFGERNQFSNDSNNLARPVNSYDLDAEYSSSITEQPHRLNFALTGELPFGRGKTPAVGAGSGAHPVRRLGGHRGRVLPERLPGRRDPGHQQLGRVRQGPAAEPDRHQPRDRRQHLRSLRPACSCINNWFNPAAWSQAPAFTFGNAPRTDTRMRTPFKTQTDVAFQKTEPMGGGRAVMLRAEMINIFNNAQFNGPNTRFGSSSFGRISSTRGFPRLLQLMVRFAF